MADSPVRLAIDVGGTFTDVQVFDARGGRIAAHKTPTTPHDPSEGLVRGITEAAVLYGFGLDEVGYVLHGTTIATNAVLERKLPQGAVVTTAGFEDVLEIGRHLRRHVYTLLAEPRAVLVPRRHRFGISARIAADGRETVPINGREVDRLIARLGEAGVEAVAIALLHAYANPAHEEALAARVAAALPGLAVSISSEISPEIREFERTSTTVLNALLLPVVRGYLERIEARLAAAGCRARLFLVQSNGGVTTPAQAARQPVRLLLSGPAGGAAAVERLAHDLGERDLVAIDMGGTSSDVSLVREGRGTTVAEGEVDGLPVRVPMVEMRTIGAGGGSIARVDAGGALKVGPASAGAVPGPAAYGRGGAEPTVTDANVVLGRLDPNFFLGGALRLDGDAARAAVGNRVARPLALGIEAAAAGIVALANANMAAAIRLALFEKGADPRDFALVPFGGAAGLHAIALAEELEIRRVIFPADPATLSARGILFADIVHDVARSRPLPALEASLPALAEAAAELRTRGEERLAADGIPPADREIALGADMCYRGQAFEIPVPWGDVEPGPETLALLVERFHALHEARFAHADPAAAVEIVTLRAIATGRLEKPAIRPVAAGEPAPSKGSRRVWLAGGWREVPVHDRASLGRDRPLAGPAIVEEAYTTLLVPAGWQIAAGAGGELVATRE